MPSLSTEQQVALLTIAVTTHNRWAGCQTAMEALVRSGEKRIDLLVVDDCSSSPAPVELLAFFKRNGIRYHRHDKNKGLAAARNTAIRLSRGEFFSFCDDDDVWSMDMVARFLGACEACAEDVDAIIGYPKPKNRSCKILHDNRPLRQLMTAGITPPVASQVYRTSLLREVRGYREHIRTGVDHDLWVTLAGKGCNCMTMFDIAPTIGTSPTATRMTTNEKARREGLEKSLDIWQPELMQTFGAEFAMYFRACYQRYLNFSFFKKAAARRSVGEAIRRLAQHGALRLLIRAAARKAGFAKYCGEFTPFKGRVASIAQTDRMEPARLSTHKEKSAGA